MLLLKPSNLGSFAPHEGHIIGASADSCYGSVDEESNDFRLPQAADSGHPIGDSNFAGAGATANLRIRVYPEDESLSMPSFSLKLEFIASAIRPTPLLSPSCARRACSRRISSLSEIHR